jgi:hypothetical protein
MDFSSLDNEQLLTLLKAAMAAASERGLAMQKAATDAVLDAQEIARIKAEALQKEQQRAAEQKRQQVEEQARQEAKAKVAQTEIKTEAQKVKASWESRKAIGVALEKWGVTEDWQINVWSRGADVRVYVDGGGERVYDWKMCLYITGNSYHPPGEMTIEGTNHISTDSPLADKANRQLFKQFLEAVNDRWRSLKVTNTEVAGFSGESNQQHLSAYLKALGINGENTNV